MPVSMDKKYGSTPFDPSDPNDAVGDRARLAVIRAYTDAISSEDELSDRQLEYILSGLLIGLVQVTQAIVVEKSDQTDAAIRSSIIQITPWAVDMARSALGQPPLSDGN